MPSESEQVTYSAMHCEKSLSLADRFESPHLSFPQPRG